MSVTVPVTPSEAPELDIFSTSREQLENIGDWSSRYDIPAMVPVTVKEPSSDEDEYDDDPDRKWHWIPEGGRKNALTLFEGLVQSYFGHLVKSGDDGRNKG